MLTFITKAVGEPPQVVDVPEDDDASYQVLSDAVGGYIECVPMALPGLIDASEPTPGGVTYTGDDIHGPVKVDCWVNEEGVLLELPRHFYARDLTDNLLVGGFIQGGVAFTGLTGPAGETLGLDAEQITAVLALFDAQGERVDQT